MQCREVRVGSCVYVRHKDTEVIGVVTDMDGDFARISHALYRYKRGDWKSMAKHYKEYEGEPIHRLNLCTVDYWDVLYDNNPKEIFVNVGSAPE